MCFAIKAFSHLFSKPRYPPLPQPENQSEPDPTSPPIVRTTADINGLLSPDTTSITGTLAGTCKHDAEMWEFYINMVERQTHEEAEANPARRQNAEVCLSFVRQHGYPGYGYQFLVHGGILEVFTEEEYRDDRLSGELLR